MKIEINRYSIAEIQGNVEKSITLIRGGKVINGIATLVWFEKGEDHLYFELLFCQLYVLWGQLAVDMLEFDKQDNKGIETESSYINEQCDPSGTFDGLESLDFKKTFLLFFRIQISSEQRRDDCLYKHFVTLYFMGARVFSTFWRTGQGDKYDKDYQPFYDKDNQCIQDI